MSGPSWTLRCRTCKSVFGPILHRSQATALLDGLQPLGCGHIGADVVSQSL